MKLADDWEEAPTSKCDDAIRADERERIVNLIEDHAAVWLRDFGPDHYLLLCGLLEQIKGEASK